MAKTIFFSWQSDTPDNIGRSFIRKALEEACSSIASDTTLDEAVRDLSVDSDTQGVAGQPPIVETIFKKIDVTGVFVADVTLIGKRPDDRPIPNPNVLIEYGWALKSLTNKRVICVMNEAYGIASHDNLPFDMAHLRWPIRYSLGPDSTAEKTNKEKNKLVNSLKEAIRLNLGTIPVPTTTPPPKFLSAEAKDGPGRFRSVDEAIGFEDDTSYRTNKEVFLTPGPALWLKILPSVAQNKEWKTTELKTVAVKGSLLIPLISSAGGYSYVRATDGEGMFQGGREHPSKKDALETDSLAFVFKTGEVWSIDTTLLGYKSNKLYSTEIERLLAQGATIYSRLLHELGVQPPYKWEAGLTGIKGRQLAFNPPPGRDWMREGGPICVSDVVKACGEIDITKKSATTALLPFFKKIFEECGIDRPDYLPH